MELFKTLKAKVRPARKRILLPETGDERVLRAAAQIQQEGFAQPVLLGDSGALAEPLRRAGADPKSIEFLPNDDPKRLETLAARYFQLRKHKGITPEDAQRTVRNPLYYGALLVREEEVDGMTAGSASPSSHVIRAALQCVGMRPGIKTLSSCFLMVLPNPAIGHEGILLFADCGVVPEPTMDQLVDITRSAAASWRLFTGTEPIVALLSFSTKGSAKEEGPRRMVEAAERLHREEPDLVVDGELQADAALVPDVARRKCPASPVGGRANVLIFPNLAAGNIGYKLAERVSGGEAVGPILQGLAKPVNDLSRGASVQAIVDAVALTAVQAVA